MPISPFPRLPQTAILSLGGYSCLKPAPWRKYVQATIRQRYPKYYFTHPLHPKEDTLWMENDCIFASLDEYLFAVHGVSLPSETLFKVYNPRGEGLLPASLLAAMASVLEPIGFEVDKVLVPDAELRSNLDRPDKVFGLTSASQFHNLPGICMLNIKNGFSHAFYWERMDQDKFTQEQFRMAVLIRRVDTLSQSPRSPVGSLAAYCEMIRTYTQSKPVRSPASLKYLTQLDAELHALSHSIQEFLNENSDFFHNGIDRQIDAISGIFQRLGSSSKVEELKQDSEEVIEASRLIHRIFREFKAVV